MSEITTHILDVSIGRPAAGVSVRLDRLNENGWWDHVGSQQTDADGRARELVPEGQYLVAAVHQLTFDTGSYFGDRQLDTFYEHVLIRFVVIDVSQHYHVPLLLSPFGYSTYRGS